MSPDDILTFWLDDVGEKGWYEVNENLDKTIRDRFYASWIELCAGSFGLWLTYPSGALAYICLPISFPGTCFAGIRTHLPVIGSVLLLQSHRLKGVGIYGSMNPPNNLFTLLWCIQKTYLIKIDVSDWF